MPGALTWHREKNIDLKERQMVDEFVERIEINQETKTDSVYLLADLEMGLYRRYTRGAIGNCGVMR